MKQIPLYVVVPPRALLLDLAGPIEVVRRANVEQSQVQFSIHHVGPRRTVMTSVGVSISGIDPLPRRLSGNAIVMVCGSLTELSARRDPRAHRDRDDEAAIIAWLRNHAGPETLVITICSGALLAARAGLLDGHACTTHYLCIAELAKLAPRARVLEDRLYVEDRNRLTSAGITAGIDLMLHVVAQLVGDSHALAVARYMVVYLRRTGSEPQLSPWLDGRNHIHPAVHRVQDAIAADPKRAWPASVLAKIAGTSTRHLSRLFVENTAMTVPDYRNRLRVALARELLTHTQLDMERVAERSGFGSTRQLRRAWHQLFGAPPREARPKPRN